MEAFECGGEGEIQSALKDASSAPDHVKDYLILCRHLVSTIILAS